MRIRALTLDLDDTLWPIAPVMQRAEQRLDDWLQQHCPEIAAAFPIPSMRELRDRVFAENPHLAHDFTELRKISLRAMFTPFGFGDDWVERAYSEFYTARNEVEYYEDALPALQRLAACVPLVSISNGNADLERMGLNHFFQFSLCARSHGVAKPHPDIFHAACRRLGCAPNTVLHVGDDPLLDVAGAQSAGLRTVWLNRHDALWPLAAEQTQPDLVLSRLDALADWLENHLGQRHTINAIAQ